MPQGSNGQRRVDATKYEPNFNDDEDGGQVDKRKSVVQFDQNVGNGESRI